MEFITVMIFFVLITNFRHFFSVLFHFLTCFEQPSVRHQDSQLYQYIIWYISLCVGRRLVCRSETCIPDVYLQSDIYQMVY